MINKVDKLYFKKVDLFPHWKPFTTNKNCKENPQSTIKLGHPGKFLISKNKFYLSFSNI